MVAADDSTNRALPPDSEEGSERPPGLEGKEGEKVLKPQKDQHGSGAGGSAAVGSQVGGVTPEEMFEVMKKCQNTMMDMRREMDERHKTDGGGQMNRGGWDGGWNWRDEEEGKGKNGKGKGTNDYAISLEEQQFRLLEKFESSTEAYQGWMFNLITQVAGVSGEVGKAMEDILRDTDRDVTEIKVDNPLGTEMVEKYSGELFRVLCGLTKGEANAIVRGAATTGAGGRRNGFLALKLLGKRFNPKTPGKLFRALMEVQTPG